MITYTVEVKDNGDTFWRVDGKFHRLDGPAVECPDGDKMWFIDGKELTEEEFLEKTKPAKEMTLEDVNKILGFKVKIVE